MIMRGFLANVEVMPPLVVRFRFNPQTITDRKAVSYAGGGSKSGLSSASVHAYSGGDRTLQFKLSLEGMEQGGVMGPVDAGVTGQLATLKTFLYPKDEITDVGLGVVITDLANGRRMVPPPRCVFGFGTRLLECLVTAMEITEQVYNPSLAPMRAEVNLTLTVIEHEDNPLYQYDKLARNVLAGLAGRRDPLPF